MEQKFSFKRLLSLVVVCAMLLSSFTVFAVAEEVAVIGFDRVNHYDWTNKEYNSETYADAAVSAGEVLLATSADATKKVSDLKGGNHFTWWYSVLAEYDEESGAYAITAIDAPGEGDGKAYENWTTGEGKFIFMCNTGYASTDAAGNKADADVIKTLAVGDKLYLNTALADLQAQSGALTDVYVQVNVPIEGEEEPDDSNKETIVVDGDLTDTGWTADGWTEVSAANGYWQSLPADENADAPYKFQMRADESKLYIAAELSVVAATGVRVWFKTNDEATVYTHFYDIKADSVTGRYNTSTTANAGAAIENSTAVGCYIVGEDKITVEFSVDLAEFGGETAFDCFINTFDGIGTLYYPPVPTPAEGENRLVNLPYNTWYADGDLTVTVADIVLGEIEEAPAEPENNKVEINVNENELLTDGKTGFTDNWGVVGSGDVLLIENKECQTVGMDVVLNYDLGGIKTINSLALDFYHCALVMIGYPEGQILVEVSTDGETYTEVGSYDITSADLAVGAYGTVATVCEFDAVDAAYVRASFVVGSSTGVLGDSPTDGKIFWQFASIAEVAVGEVEVVVVQPVDKVTLPDGAAGINYAGYKHEGGITIITATDVETTLGALSLKGDAAGLNGEEGDFNYWSVIIVDAEGKVIYSNATLGRPAGVKTDVVVPAGAVVIATHGGTELAKVGQIVKIYNIDLEVLKTLEGYVALEQAGYTVEDAPAEPTVEVIVDETVQHVGGNYGANDVIIDGYTGLDEIKGYEGNQPYFVAFMNNAAEGSTYSIVINYGEEKTFDTVTSYILDYANGCVVLPAAVSYEINGVVYDAVINPNENGMGTAVATLDETVTASKVIVIVTMTAQQNYFNMFSEVVVSEKEAEVLDLVEGDNEITVPAAGSVVYNANFDSDLVLTINNNWAVTVVVNGVEYWPNRMGILEAPIAAGENTVEFKNGAEEAATVTATVAAPVYGTGMDNAIVLEASGDYDAEVTAKHEQGVFYEYVATVDGTVTITINTESGWMYCINNTTSVKYGDTHWSDDDPVVATETIDVTAGDVIQFFVSTYDGGWVAPVGTVNFTLVEAEAPAEPTVQPAEKVTLPDGAAGINYAGYKHEVGITIITATDVETTLGALATKGDAAGLNGEEGDFNYWSVIIVDAEGKVIYSNATLGREVEGGIKTDVVVPAGAVVIATHNGTELAKVGQIVKIYNIDLEVLKTLEGYVALEQAGYTVEDAPKPVQPAEKVELPAGAAGINYAGYKHEGGITIITATDVETTLGALATKGDAAGLNGEAGDFNYWSVIIVDAEGKVIYSNATLGREVEGGIKTDVVVPAGAVVIATHSGTELAKVGQIVKIYNIDLEVLKTREGYVALEQAGYTVEDAPVVGTEVKLGDVNQDGEIDKFDYILIKRQCMGTYDLDEDEWKIADVTGEGDVDKFDYILIKRHCMKTYTIEGTVII